MLLYKWRLWLYVLVNALKLREKIWINLNRNVNSLTVYNEVYFMFGKEFQKNEKDLYKKIKGLMKEVSKKLKDGL